MYSKSIASSRVFLLHLCLLFVLLFISAPKVARAEVDSLNLIEDNAAVIDSCNLFKQCILTGKSPTQCNVKSEDMNSPCETKVNAVKRHANIAVKRTRRLVIAHRGAREFAPDNTLASYLASIQLGADGNEMDIRKTSDGILIMFHDDMTDYVLDNVYERIEMYPYNKVKNMRVRMQTEDDFGLGCIPTFLDTLILHMRYNGLMYIEAKDPDIEQQIAEYYDVLDMWDHLVAIDPRNSTNLRTNPKYKSPISGYKDLLQNRDDVNPTIIQSAVSGTANFFVVDDPRAMVSALNRQIKSPSINHLKCVAVKSQPVANTEGDLIRIILNAPNWNKIPQTDAEKVLFARQIMERGHAINDAIKLGYRSLELIDALKERVNKRSIHSDWLYHGLDSQEALFALTRLSAKNVPTLLRSVIWKNDPLLTPISTVGYPATFVDWRIKHAVWDLAKKIPAAELLINDYLALDDESAKLIGPHHFEEAALALIRIKPQKETASFLLNHRRLDVQGRTLLELLKRAGKGEQWACDAIKLLRPDAEPWIVFAAGKSCL